MLTERTVGANPVVSYAPSAWEDDGEQLRDWSPVYQTDVPVDDLIVEECRGSPTMGNPGMLFFRFVRADGLVLTVDEVGLADGIERLRGSEARDRINRLTTEGLVRAVKQAPQDIGRAIFAAYSGGNPFRAVLG